MVEPFFTGRGRRTWSRLPARSVLLHTLYAVVSTGDPLLACRLGRCFCILCMQRSPQETRFSPVGSVGASAYLYAEASTGDPHPSTLSECPVFIFCTYKKQQTPQKRCLPFWQGQKDLNPRHSVLETDALPTELYP